MAKHGMLGNTFPDKAIFKVCAPLLIQQILEYFLFHLHHSMHGFVPPPSTFSHGRLSFFISAHSSLGQLLPNMSLQYYLIMSFSFDMVVRVRNRIQFTVTRNSSSSPWSAVG